MDDKKIKRERRQMNRMRHAMDMFKYNKAEFGLKYALGYAIILNDRWECSRFKFVRNAYKHFHDYGYGLLHSQD